MRMKRSGAAAAILAACMLTVSVGGCGRGDDIGTKVVLTTGFDKDEIFRIETSSCSLPELMVYLTTIQNRYESVYGREIWQTNADGVTLEENVKNIALAQIAQIKTMNLLAQQYNVTLNSTEKEQARAAAAQYFSSLNDAEIEAMQVTQETIETLYSEFALANKVYEYIIKDINPEISDDEARIITVWQIHLDTRESAEEILEKLAQEKEFMTLASAYSKDSQISYTFGRGEKPAAYEEAAFALENEGVSGIIEEEDGYYILKCVNNFDREATEANKVTMVERRRDEIFSGVYEELVANTPSEFNTKIWEQVHFEDWTGGIPESFLEVYSRYFEGE